MKCLLLLIFAAKSLTVPYKLQFDNEKVFRITPQNKEEVDFIKHLATVTELNFWTPQSLSHLIPNITVDFHANAEDSATIISLLEQKRIDYRIIFQNLQEAIENQFDKDKHKQKDRLLRSSRYHTWEELAAWAHHVSVKYPKLVSLVPIGKTYEGRPMHVLKVGNKVTSKKGIVLECGAHAREWISPAFCKWFVTKAIKAYNKDKDMTNLLDSVMFHVIPVFNIDGYVWTWTHNRMWRKNRSPSPNSKCIGTDLNRNFNIAWQAAYDKKNPCSDIYPGSGPESEMETKAITSYIRDNVSSLKAYLSLHAYGQMLMYPYGYTVKKPSNQKKLEEIASSAVKALSRLYGTQYTYGPIASTIYLVTGSSVDWVYDEGVKYSFAIELRDKGTYGFLLPEDQIKPTCMETMLAVKEIASFVINLES
ncbi:hypothetical protein GDO86_018652 [Hymenochirus boettgeri]|uniref:Peptidase M14 domain-containing protein n=1 Tax=Hymenochirus boettgeri TaxID=247094 RepID=A0A8T2IMU4_9PIPI|nr:hypothetical protein GDO86_018652 [Hymenochirus boettgeri]